MDRSSAAASGKLRWTDGLTAMHWRTLFGSFLGWIFDGYEAMAPILVMAPLLHSVLTPSQAGNAAVYAGGVLGIALVGWGVGGLIGGVAADYFGRKRVMLASVLLYALFSGATAFAHSFEMLGAMRFLTGIAMGGEWSTGIALVSESWPDHARAKGLSFLQSGYGWGTLLAAAIWYALSRYAPSSQDNWRIMFLIGALPALFVLYLRRGVDESEKWAVAIRNRQWSQTGPAGTLTTTTSRPFPLRQLLASSDTRSRMLLSLLLSMVTSTGLWAVSSWLPAQTTALAKAAGLQDPALWGTKVSLAFTLGAIVAYLIAGFIIDRIGRRAFVCLTFTGSLIMTIVSYRIASNALQLMWLAPIDGFFTLGCAYVWMAIYPAELFVSSVRASAISFIFNGARLIIWVFPIAAGALVHRLGGIPHAALAMGSIYLLGVIAPWFLPETRDLPFPD
ncbi:MFS transporter [Burkholderia sp. 22PA0106]|uniref:MFS transporter n=1 Tax=Burkholderia sp. 22PA0106 TaxID=3237371 RepID=UPI0039C300C3